MSAGCQSVRQDRLTLRPPVIVALTVAASMFTGTAGVAAQQIRGIVVEAGSRQPVANATLTLLDHAGRRLLRLTTDSAGAFTAALPRAGDYALRVEKYGYEALDTEPFPVTLEEVLELRIFVGVDVVELAPVEVTARRREPPGPQPAFWRRLYWGRQTGEGRFFTREDIRNTGLIRTSSLLRQVPPSMQGGLNCRSALYLNGMEIRVHIPIDDLVTLDDLEGIEIYRRRSEMPIELASADVCSAVVLWTRAGYDEKVSAPGWRRTLAVGAALTGAILVGMLMR